MAVADPRSAGSEPGAAEMPEELNPRHLEARVAQVAAVIVFVVIAVSTVPGLDDIKERIANADPAWLAAIAAAELGSCLGYVLAFKATFCTQMSWRLSYDIAMAELAANSLLPAGGAGGLALGVWALRQAGMPTAHVARRTVAFFVVTSAPNFAGVAVFGLATWVGLIPGSDSILLTLVPALAAAVAMTLVALSPSALRALGTPKHETGRIRAALRKGLGATADGVEQAVLLLRSRHAGVLVGAVAYLGFDIAALGCAFASMGHMPAVSTLVLAYLIGQLGNLVPLPGGIGGTEGALIAVFALFGVGVATASAAVLTFRLFQLVLPALLGTPAFVLLRRQLLRADHPAAMCAPLAVEAVRLPAPGTAA